MESQGYDLRNAASQLTAAKRSLPDLVADLDGCVAHARQLVSRAYGIGDHVFGPTPTGIEQPGDPEGPPTLERVSRKLNAALNDLDCALSRL